MINLITAFAAAFLVLCPASVTCSASLVEERTHFAPNRNLVLNSATQVEEQAETEDSHGEHGDWTALSKGGGTLSSSLNYFLDDDVILENDIVINADITLCLNGMVLTGTGNGPVITVNSNRTLTICDCQESPIDEIWEADSEVTIEAFVGGGFVTGGSSRKGGGIYVNGGTFVLEGGSISYNDSGISYGGAVCVEGGSFVMNGGTLSENAATNGAGVYVGSEGSFTLNRGVISANSGSYGGGVYVDSDSEFEMNGGSVWNWNTAFSGAGVHLATRATFTLNDGLFFANFATLFGGGAVYVSASAALYLNGGLFNINISYSASASGGAIHVASLGRLIMTGGTLFTNYYFLENAVMSDIYLASNARFTLSGGYIEYVRSSTSNISVTGGYFGSSAYSTVRNYIDDGYIGVNIANLGGESFDGEYKEGFSDAVYREGEGEYSAKDIDAVYGEEIVPAVLTSPQTEVEYSWVETSGHGASAGEEGEGLPSNAGTYVVTASYDAMLVTTYDDDQKPIKTFYDSGSVTFALTIDKADPTYEVPSGLAMCGGHSLSEIDLEAFASDDGTWVWSDGDALIEESGLYPALYIPSDGDNYNAVSASIYVTMTEHVRGEEEIENDVAATCTEEGTYDSVYYCTICGDELSRENLVSEGAKGHREGDPVTENRKYATCTSEGSYESAVYCLDCGVELSRESHVIEASGHSYNLNSNENGHWRRCVKCLAATEVEEHEFGEWMNAADGIQARSCAICFYSENREVMTSGEKKAIIIGSIVCGVAVIGIVAGGIIAYRKKRAR